MIHNVATIFSSDHFMFLFKMRVLIFFALAASGGFFSSWGIAATGNEAFSVFEVPAVSSVPQLPDRLGANAKPTKVVRIIATPGEYEPASFVVVPHVELPDFNVVGGTLTGPNGATIDSANVNLRIVKCWYQGGTAWYSYFADPHRREFVPELLLKDDALVKVDREKQDNYLRIGNEYRLISYSAEDAVDFFNYYTEPVHDATTLQPLTLKKNENQQYWLTLKVPEDAKPGTYRGDLSFVSGEEHIGSLGVEVRVLPFELPPPKTYYDLDSDFLVSIYSTDVLKVAKILGIAHESATAIQKAIYKNLLEHNVTNALASMSMRGSGPREQSRMEILEELRLMRDAGLTMRPLITNGWAYYSGTENKEKDGIEHFKQRVEDYTETVAKELGHRDIYLASFDEPNREQTLLVRNLAEQIHDQGQVKLWLTTAKDMQFDLAGYAIDLANQAGWPDRNEAAHWHAIGSKIVSYAGPHTGPENPDLFRRWEGLARYKENYDGSFNYEYFSQLHPTLYKKWKQNVWNDFSGTTFRGFNMVYPTADGVVDTIAWEGFREGIDDIRYATKLKQVAREAIQSGDIKAVYAARKALMWLELLDAKTADLRAVRLEMINYILKIQEARR